MDKYKMAEDIIAKRFDKDNINYALYYLCCYGLLDKFGDKYLELVEKFFLKCDFYIDNKLLKELMESANCSGNDIDISPNTLANCSCGNIVLLDEKTKSLRVVKSSPKIFYSTNRDNANLDLISVSHEAAHIIKGFKNSISILPDKSGVFIRDGLFVEFHETDGRSIFIKHFHSMFDEVINVLQTSDMMKSIKNIDRGRLSDEVLSFFDKLDLKSLDSPFGYDEHVGLVKDLWDNEYFKNSIEESVVEGNLGECFKKLGDSFVSDLCYTLDYLDFSDIKSSEQSKECIRIKKMVDAYNKRSMV